MDFVHLFNLQNMAQQAYNKIQCDIQVADRMHVPSHVFVTLLILKPGLQMHSYDGCRLTQVSDDEQLLVFMSKHSFTSVFINTESYETYCSIECLHSSKQIINVTPNRC